MCYSFFPAEICGLNISKTANETADGDFSLLANKINQFLHSVSADFSPITADNTYLTHTLNQPIDDKYLVTVADVEKQLMNVKPGKAAGPDGIQAWLLRDLAPILAPPRMRHFQ